MDTEAHRQLALEAAHQMIVLLKNDNGMLPLSVSKVHLLVTLDSPYVYMKTGYRLKGLAGSKTVVT